MKVFAVFISHEFACCPYSSLDSLWTTKELAEAYAKAENSRIEREYSDFSKPYIYFVRETEIESELDAKAEKLASLQAEIDAKQKELDDLRNEAENLLTQ